MTLEGIHLEANCLLSTFYSPLIECVTEDEDNANFPAKLQESVLVSGELTSCHHAKFILVNTLIHCHRRLIQMC